MRWKLGLHYVRNINYKLKPIVRGIEIIFAQSIRLCATLTFHGVSDLVISINYAKATACVQPMTIHEIHREVEIRPNGYSLFNWTVEINWPPQSFISFSSSGFTQVLHGQPIVSGAQYLTHLERQAALHLTPHSSGTPNGAP